MGMPISRREKTKSAMTKKKQERRTPLSQPLLWLQTAWFLPFALDLRVFQKDDDDDSDERRNKKEGKCKEKTGEQEEERKEKQDPILKQTDRSGTLSLFCLWQEDGDEDIDGCARNAGADRARRYGDKEDDGKSIEVRAIKEEEHLAQGEIERC